MRSQVKTYKLLYTKWRPLVDSDTSSTYKDFYKYPKQFLPYGKGVYINHVSIS